MSEVKAFNELVDAFASAQDTARLKGRIDLKVQLIDLIERELQAGIPPYAILSNLVSELGKVTNR